ncbi:hypothetical protein TFLX_05986 [Thermoflexales bacterium]|nr:hypothetical protein TFLX_05986 [Thermoflexales bacterium]
MPESVQQVLMRGIAAAKSMPPGDYAESRAYLKRVLCNPTASIEQKTTAWLWLSQLENDVAGKQFCLQQALELAPDNRLAQRGLAILKKRLKSQEESPLHTSNGTWRSACPQCGGTLKFELVHNQLTCQFCGYQRKPRSTRRQVIGEQDFPATLPTRCAQTWHLAIAQTLKCSGCGAAFTLPKLEISGECPFCGSLYIIETTMAADLIEPDGILTFQIDEAEARQTVETWLQRYRSLEHNIRTSRLRAVYLPYWTFDLDGEIIHSSHYRPIYDQQHCVAGGEWIRDTCHVDHDDLLVPATRTISTDLLDQVSNFSTATLQPYASEILAAWSAEVYQISLAAASLIARQRAVNAAQQAPKFALRVPTAIGLQLPYTARIDSTLLDIRSYKLVLLPVWLGRYQFKDQIYRLVVNGQTGKITGEKPPLLKNWWRKLGRIFRVA